MDSTASDNECLSDDSLEHGDGSKTRQKKKLLSKRRRKTYMELYQSRLVVELLKYEKCGNEKTQTEKQREVKKRPKRQHFLRSEYMQQKNNKIEMLKRGAEYGRRMSSLNRVNGIFKQQHPTSSSNQSLLNNDENASTSKSVKEEKISKESSRKKEELQAALEQMQIRHCQDRKKVEKIRNALMSNGIDELI